MMRIGEGEPDLLARLAHRRGAEALVLVLCPASGKRDVAGPGILRAAGTLHEAHAPGAGTAGQHDGDRRAPRGRHVEGRIVVRQPHANLLDGRHHLVKIPYTPNR